MLMLCPICAGEFQVQVSACPGCGCNLIPENVTEMAKADSPMQRFFQLEFVELCRPKLYPIAMLVKQKLEQHDVQAWVQGGNAISVMPQLAFGGDLRVFVEKEKLDFAKEIYKAYFDTDEDVDYLIEG
jgi:hypothetical protein